MSNNGVKTRNYTIEDLEQILDSIPFQVFLKNSDGKYIYVNKEIEKNTGIKREEIIGKYDIDFRSEKLAKLCREGDKITLENGTSTFIEDRIIKDNVEIENEVFKTIIIDSRAKEKLICGVSRVIERDKSVSKYIIEKCADIMNGPQSIDDELLYKEMLGKLTDITKCDCISLYFYDNELNTMKMNTKLGNSKNLFPLEYIITEEIESSYNNNDKCRIVNRLENNEVEYIYLIKNSNKLLGCIHIYYKDMPVETKEEYIKCASLVVSFMQNKKILTDNLNKELTMRSDSQKKLKLMIDSAIDYYALAKKEGNKTVWLETSKKFNEVVGWTVEDLNSINYLELIKPKDRSKVENILSDYHRKSHKVSFGLLCKNNKWVTVSANINYLADNIYMISANDISLIKKLKQEKEELQHIVELEGLKTEFFANLSHEFKTPINIILTTIQVITDFMITNQKYPDIDKFYRYISSIKQNSYRLLKLANNMIDITKIEGGFFEINMGNYNIVEVVENIIQSVAIYMKDNKRNITFDTSKEEIITACDPNQIERIILNILSNAMKFTSSNGNIYVEVDEIDNGNKVMIKIKNDGEPIDIEDSKRIFERFTQAEHLLTRKREGSGIGLSLVKSLVEMHDGIVYVNTEVKDGTEFCIELPKKQIIYDESKSTASKILNSKIERFHIEFSDIYN